ncbi:hypothetical protein [Nocardia niwae]|uniref:hypothetical protein n=1 Tax=Nocardia niwae TaxID=626084 RepID=UPI003401E61E
MNDDVVDLPFFVLFVEVAFLADLGIVEYSAQAVEDGDIGGVHVCSPHCGNGAQAVIGRRSVSRLRRAW